MKINHPFNIHHLFKEHRTPGAIFSYFLSGRPIEANPESQMSGNGAKNWDSRNNQAIYRTNIAILVAKRMTCLSVSREMGFKCAHKMLFPIFILMLMRKDDDRQRCIFRVASLDEMRAKDPAVIPHSIFPLGDLGDWKAKRSVARGPNMCCYSYYLSDASPATCYRGCQQERK